MPWTHPFQTPSYLWSTGETTASITVSSAGTCVVEVQLLQHTHRYGASEDRWNCD
ncbi:MAG: hypothetical protein IPH05_17520 [Flavobacteriales bacterium]|nr:hypothetical protein [Flavobacteriales bacterium]